MGEGRCGEASVEGKVWGADVGGQVRFQGWGQVLSGSQVVCMCGQGQLGSQVWGIYLRCGGLGDQPQGFTIWMQPGRVDASLRTII